MSLKMMRTVTAACGFYTDEIINVLSEYYKFDAAEARSLLSKRDNDMLEVENRLEILESRNEEKEENVEEVKKVKKVEKVKKVKKEKKKSSKPKVVLPFCGKVNDDTCNVVKVNHQLYTQCTNAKDGEGECCKTCGKKDAQFGTIENRMTMTKDEFENKYQVKIAQYGNVMNKLKINREDAVTEAERLGLAITEDQFEVAKSNRGRPKKSVIVSDSDDESKPKKTRGRPKKEKKMISSLNPGDDLIASLVEEAAVETSESSSEDEMKTATPPSSPPPESQPEAPKKKRVSKETVEEKKSKKETKKDLTVEIVDLKVDSEKINSPELTWESPKEEVSESEDEDAVDVEKMEWNGKDYLRDDNGNVYDLESQEQIGQWHEDDERVILYGED
jgi:hypothetical protein